MDSKAYLNNYIGRRRIIMIDKIEKKDCTGCKMCADICPVQAIEYNVDNEGFWYPTVNYDKCIKCGKCVKVCPVKQKSERTTLGKSYAGWHKQDDVRRNSTSGGLYYALAKKIIDNGGYLVSSKYTDDFKGAYHTIGNNYEDLKQLCGSKYFQSDTEGIYKKTRELLKEGKQVLFTGAPCQVAALKEYLGEEYDNLLTCDFICRGVPSPLMQKKKIEYYEKKYKSQVVDYRDKSKKVSWSYFGERIRFKNGKEKFVSRYRDWFNDCFIKYNFNIRPSCYRCRFKGMNRASDITIADFWGVRAVTDKDLRDGVSAIITNTEKGDSYLNSLKDVIYLSKRSIDSIAKGNPAYETSIKEPEQRDQFFDDVHKLPLKKAIKKNCPKNGIKSWINSTKVLVKGRIKNYKDIIKNFRHINWFQFIKYNFFCKNVVRDKLCYIIPLGKCNILFDKNSLVELHGTVLLNYYPCYKDNRITNFIVRNNAIFIANNRVEISYANTISVDNNACLTMGYFFTGVGANVICHYKMDIGNNVMLGRDVCLFDSDYHRIFDEQHNKINDDKEVIIEDNVWIGARSMVLKGTVIHNGAIIGANSLVTGEIEGDRSYIIMKSGKSVGKPISWMR